MKKIFYLLMLWSYFCFAQWAPLNIPNYNSRYDDIVFINDSTGWTVNSEGEVYKTTDGMNWTLQFSAPGEYMRSVEFATPQLGFCGTLDSTLYRTADGGLTWTNVANAISPKPRGICGLSAPSSTVVYGCGIFLGPAYVIKSTDGGISWTYTDMSAYANSLVDIYFTSPDSGFATGTANPSSDGGIVLHTTDGGLTWSVKHKTYTGGDRIWKIQSPDGMHYFGSVEAYIAGNVRMIKSNDRGMNWTDETVSNTAQNIQAIGFIDTLRGWTGGQPSLLETVDGGNTWHPISVSLGGAYNRFFRVNDSTAYLSGKVVYKYIPEAITATKKDTEENIEFHGLKVSPNPAHHSIQVEVELRSHTNISLQLFSSEGKELRSIVNSVMNKGSYTFNISLETIPAQLLYLVLHTNEGHITRKLIRN
jgi:photosystem II stability/assembly factor-like uncharacterized protein